MFSFFRKHREGILYLFFGAATTLVNFLIYTPLIRFTAWSMTLCNGIAWAGAVIFAFFTNKRFVFRSTAWDPKTVLTEAVTFLGSRVLSGILEIFLPEILFRIGLRGTVFGIDGLIAKITVTVIVILLNYVLSKFFVFRK